VVGRQPIEKLQTVDIGKSVVEQNAVRRRGTALAQSLFAARGLGDDISVFSSLDNQTTISLPIFGAIVDDEDAMMLRVHAGVSGRGRMTISNQ
jgi:hypothetical protein